MRKSNWRRVISIMILSIFILVSNIDIVVYAQSSVKGISYEIKGTTNVNDEYEILINSNNIRSLYGFSLDFAYDSNLIEVLEVSKGDAFKDTNAKEVVNTNTNQQVNLAVVLLGNSSVSAKESGTLAKIKVKALKEGIINLKTIDDNSALDKNSNNVRIKLSDSNGNKIKYQAVSNYSINQISEKEFSVFEVDNVALGDTAVSGQGLSGATVKAFVDGKQIGSTAKVATDGKYKIAIPEQKAGTKVFVRMEKSGYTTSEKYTTILNRFSTFTINNLTKTDTTIGGKGLAEATVKAFVGGKQIGSNAKVATDGNYKITIPVQKAGTKIVVSMEKLGYSTESKEITVLDEIDTFTINNVSKSSTEIIGKGMAGFTVKAFVDGKQIGDTTKVTSYGNFKVTIPKQKAGAKILIKMGKSGYLTGNKEIVVLDEVSTFTINNVSKSSTEIIGKGMAGFTVKAFVNGKQIGNTTKVTSYGNFKVTIPKQKAGTKILIKMGKSGYVTANKEIPVLDEVSTFTINNVSKSSTEIIGKGMAGFTVKAFVDGKQIGNTTKVTSYGNFKVTIPKQKAGTKILIKMGKSGYVTANKEIPVLDEVSTFTINNVSKSTTEIIGKGMAGFTVKAFVNGKQIGNTTKVTSYGNFKVTIPKQKAGTKILIKMGKSGYVTANKEIPVLDEVSTFTINNVSKSSTEIIGKGMAGFTVKAFVNGKQIGNTTKVTSYGNFKVTIPKQKAGTKILIKMGKSGYVTANKEIPVLDEVSTFTINNVSKSSTEIIGKGMAGFTVKAFVNGKQIGNTTKVTSYGNFKVTIPKQKAGTKILIKMGKSGYVTANKEIKVS